MPKWKTHLIFSLFLLVAWMSVFNFVGLSLNLSAVITLLIFVIFASLFPDIDMKKSKIRDALAVAISTAVAAVYLVFFFETWYYAFVYFLLLYFILKYIPSKHRGIAHSFKFSAIFSLALASVCFVFRPFTPGQFAFWFVVVFSSYGLHLVLDKA